MEIVNPIKSRETIEAIKAAMFQDGKDRERALFIIGINSGLRISDLLSLRWKDVEGATVKIKEQKTGKTKRFPLNQACIDALETLEKGNPEAFIFESNSNRAKGKAWGNQYVWSFMNEYGRRFGLTEIGTHSLRKTFGFFAFQATKSIEVVQKLLNHSSPATTLRYIGIEQQELDAVYTGLNL